MTDNINSVSLHGNNNTDRDELHINTYFIDAFRFTCKMNWPIHSIKCSAEVLKKSKT